MHRLSFPWYIAFADITDISTFVTKQLILGNRIAQPSLQNPYILVTFTHFLQIRKKQHNEDSSCYLYCVAHIVTDIFIF